MDGDSKLKFLLVLKPIFMQFHSIYLNFSPTLYGKFNLYPRKKKRRRKSITSKCNFIVSYTGLMVFKMLLVWFMTDSTRFSFGIWYASFASFDCVGRRFVGICVSFAPQIIDFVLGILSFKFGTRRQKIFA